MWSAPRGDVLYALIVQVTSWFQPRLSSYNFVHFKHALLHDGRIAAANTDHQLRCANDIMQALETLKR